MSGHNYVLEIDVIEAAGLEAVQRLAEKGNHVYVPFEEMERRAALKEKDIYSLQFAETLNFITENGQKEGNKHQYLMPMGGSVKWGKPTKSSIHLTRDPSTKSLLKRKGVIFEEPDFLKYGPQILKEGFKDLQYDLDVENISLESLCSETGLEPVNNQIIRLNNTSLIYKVVFPLISNSDGSRFDLDEDNGELIRINFDESRSLFSDFRLRTLEQKIVYNLLLDKNIEMQIVSGGSGSGKTILSYVAAVEQILGTEKQRNLGQVYDGIILFKSNDIIGGKSREQGFLPGTAYQKVKPFMKSYEDAHKLAGMNKGTDNISFSEMLADPCDENDEFGLRKKHKIAGLYLPARDKAIEIEHLQYARGRTFENKFIIVDEAQNDTPYEIKQLIERVGIGCKILIIGDPEQIDNPRLNREYNGLVYATNVNFNTHPRFSTSYLSKNYRSQSAEIMRGRRAPRE